MNCLNLTVVHIYLMLSLENLVVSGKLKNNFGRKKKDFVGMKISKLPVFQYQMLFQLYYIILYYYIIIDII